MSSTEALWNYRVSWIQLFMGHDVFLIPVA